MARPLGVVFDESISSCLNNLDHFQNDNVYVKGLAETEPILVYSTKNTVISNIFKRPFTEPEWRTELYNITFQELKKLTGKKFEYILQKIPLDASQIILKLAHPSTTATGFHTYYTWNMNENKNIYYSKEGCEHKVGFFREYILDLLSNNAVPLKAEIRLEFTYPVKEL